MSQAKYFVLNSLESFKTRQRGLCSWSETDSVFHLAVMHKPRFPKINHEQAITAWKNSSPIVVDKFKQLGFLSADKKQLFYALNWHHKQLFDYENTLTETERLLLKTRATAGPVLVTREIPEGDTASDISLSPVIADEDTTFVDLHLGGDGRVALIYSDGDKHHGLRVVHLSRRWQLHLDWQDTEGNSFKPKRCWVDQNNRIWIASDDRLAVFEGEPLPQAYNPRQDRFEPLFVNPNSLRKVWETHLLPERELIALCANETQIHLLFLMSDLTTQEMLSFSLNYQAEQTPVLRRLPELPFVTDIASPFFDKIFLQMFTQSSEVEHCDFVALLIEQDEFVIEKRSYPIHSQLSVRFVRGVGQESTYLASDGPKRILPLPQARYMKGGDATLNKLLDSGNPGTWWDRIYLDASVPTGCELSISVNVFDDAENPSDDWQLQPLAMKLPYASELPFYKNNFDYKASHQGLYEIVLQRTSGSVRDIRGRYMQLMIHMRGDGRHTPAIECIRVVYPRFSWQENYLPPVFHQTRDPDKNDKSSANGADFRERMLSIFDGMFSPIENRIASAESWLLPQATPSQHLPILAAMLGETLPSAWPEMRKRLWLACLSELQRLKGTYAGLCLALEIATDGALSKGQIVPVEHYLMRRTLATILGVDMDDAEHPLTLGTRQSGNSIVGETLILSDETSREFVSLLAPELLTSSDKQIEVDFLDRYANRISIIVHNHARPHIKNIERLIQDFVPASMSCRLMETDNPFVLGLSPLLGIDTYLEVAVAARQIILDDTYLGREGLLRNQATFSPRDLIFGDQAISGGQA
jgi:phage tail-like protein